MQASLCNSLQPTNSSAVNDSPARATDAMAGLIESVALRQDRDAYVRLYSHFAPRVKSFLMNKGLDPAAADDVLQEVMLAVWQKSHLYDSTKAAVSTWIFTVARNHYINRLRREHRQPGAPDDPDLRAADTRSSLAEVSLDQRRIAVRQAMTRLCPEQREVIALSFAKGLAHSEIAKRLDLPLGTVKSRIRLGFMHLRDSLGVFRPLDEECLDA